MAAVVRDHSGIFIVGRCSKYEVVSHTFLIELLACRDAMLLAVERGFSFKFQFGRRSTNGAAHTCSKEALDLFTSCFF